MDVVFLNGNVGLNTQWPLIETQSLAQNEYLMKHLSLTPIVNSIFKIKLLEIDLVS